MELFDDEAQRRFLDEQADAARDGRQVSVQIPHHGDPPRATL